MSERETKANARDGMPYLTTENLNDAIGKQHKYGARRTKHNGEWYDSKAEAEYAAMLDLQLDAHDIKSYERQVKIPLGADDSLRVDFVVTEWHDMYAVDVKGVETPDFRRKAKLWRDYGTMDLLVMKRKGGKWVPTRVPGGMADA
ncbi:MAG: DUF1064 domain-containing protein [Planctomycetota bacterium]|jgi:hypothetical protein